MANRLMEEKINSLEKKLAIIAGRIVIGAAGAVASHNIKGVVSVARTGAGVYTITLQDAWTSLLAGQVSLQAAAASAIKPSIQSETVATTKIVVIRCDNAVPAAADPASGDVINVSLWLKNTSI